MKPLTGQTAIITGASAPRGIGRAIARRLADEGAAVVVTDIGAAAGAQNPRDALLRGLVADITAAGGTAISAALDVTSPDEIAEVLALTMSRFGRVDILVNNAGSLAGAGNFMTTTPSDWRTSFEVNLLGPMMLSQAVIPQMQRQGGGRIINIGSVGSLGAEAGFGAYTAMKHALAGFTKTMAAEFGPDGILCNTVCPGFIATDMHMAANTRLASEQGMPIEDMRKQRYARVALRDAGQPGDVADAVAWLAGPQARYVTGINLPVAGGVPFGI